MKVNYKMEVLYVEQSLAAIVKEAGKLILTARDIGSSVSQKGSPRDLVTEYDTRVQEFLRQRLREAFPDYGFFGEEEHSHDIRGKAGFFIVDPIDGTTNFVRRLHHSCISVGLCLEGEMVSAAVYNPYYDELFTATRGGGAYLNGTRLHMKSCPIEESLVLFGSAIYYRDTIPATVRLVEELFPITLDFRRGGSAALDLCYLAAGGGDLFFEACLQPWDYAAGSLIVEEAGGIVTALNGSPLRLTEQCSVAAGNGINHPQLLRIAQTVAREPEMKGRIK